MLAVAGSCKAAPIDASSNTLKALGYMDIGESSDYDFEDQESAGSSCDSSFKTAQTSDCACKSERECACNERVVVQSFTWEAFSDSPPVQSFTWEAFSDSPTLHDWEFGDRDDETEETESSKEGSQIARNDLIRAHSNPAIQKRRGGVHDLTAAL